MINYYVYLNAKPKRIDYNTKLIMKKILTILFLCFTLTQVFAQKYRKMSLYLEGQYNQTIADVTKGNNPWGTGLGLQMFFRQQSMFKPTIEFTADAYLMDDKVYRAYLDGTPVGSFKDMVNLFAGLSVHPITNVYVSFLAGPSFIGGQTLLGLKPSLGFYFSSKQKLTGKISYINILEREVRAKQNFTSTSIALGVKLF